MVIFFYFGTPAKCSLKVVDIVKWQFSESCHSCHIVYGKNYMDSSTLVKSELDYLSLSIIGGTTMFASAKVKNADRQG